MHYTFFVNPAAQSGQTAHIWTNLARYLDKQQITYDAHLSQKMGDITRWAISYSGKQHQKDEYLIVVGGDGSLNEAINGLLRYKNQPEIAVGYIPAGSGNDFGRAHGLNTDPLKRLKRILELTTQREQPTRVDIGKYHDMVKNEQRYFVNNVGMGFDAATVALTNSSYLKTVLNKIHLGGLAYFMTLFKVFAKQRSFQVEIEDGRRYEILKQGYLLTISNHPYFGGGVKIMADADPTDGLLDVIIIEKKSMIRILKLFVALLRGQHYQYPEVHRWTSDIFRIKVASMEYGHADGEEIGPRSYDFKFSSQSYPFWL